MKQKLLLSLVLILLSLSHVYAYTVYYSPKNEYVQQNCNYAVWYWNDLGNVSQWTNWMQKVQNVPGWFSVNIPDGYEHLIFVTFSSGVSTPSWGEETYQSNDLSYNPANIYYVEGIGWGNSFRNVISHVQIGSLYYNLDTDSQTASVTYQQFQSSNNYPNMTSVQVPSSVNYNNTLYTVTSIGEYAFYQSSNLQSITIPNTITTIGFQSFVACHNLTSFNVPNSGIITIENYAFAGCGFTSIVIPNTVVKIGLRAFQNCSNLSSVTLGSGLTGMGEYVFYNSSNINKITCHAAIPPYLGGAVFGELDLTDISLYVPRGSVNVYLQTEQWQDFYTIKPIPPYIVTFVDYDETTLETQYVNEGESATTPATPSREGYTFIGWDKTFNYITNDITITALYTITYYPVGFLNYDGTLLSEQSIAYNHAAMEPNVPTREGYTFIGWTADIEHITARTFVIALYEKDGINVTYISEEGDTIVSEKVDMHLPDAPVVPSKTFAGWLTESASNAEGIVLRATYTSDNPTTGEDVVVIPTSSTAGVSFPYITGAMTYMLVIRDLFGTVVCKIMFDADGHLLGIAFAPGRNRTQKAQSEGFHFTVEGLTPGTTYEYEFVAYDEADQVIETLTGSFETTADATGVNNIFSASAPQKVINDGHVLILRGDKTYTMQGQEVE